MSSISISTYPGYPTSSAMRVYVDFTVSSAGTYDTYFHVYNVATGALVTTASGKSYTLSAGEGKGASHGDSDFYKTITGLSPYTHYYIEAYLRKSGANVVTSRSIYFKTLGSGTRPSNWSWTSTVSQGAAMSYTQSGDNIIVKPLTATEWKNFVSRIQSFASYCNVTLNSTYLSNATSGVSSGSRMTATQVNAARYLINQLSPPTAVPSSVSSGGRITAAFINGLKNSLNSIG